MKNETGFADLDNKPIYENDILEIYSVGAKVGIGEIQFCKGKYEVAWFGDYTYGLVRDLKYLVANKSIKVIDKPLYLRN